MVSIVFSPWNSGLYSARVHFQMIYPKELKFEARGMYSVDLYAICLGFDVSKSNYAFFPLFIKKIFQDDISIFIIIILFKANITSQLLGWIESTSHLDVFSSSTTKHVEPKLPDWLYPRNILPGEVGIRESSIFLLESSSSLDTWDNSRVELQLVSNSQVQTSNRNEGMEKREKVKRMREKEKKQ